MITEEIFEDVVRMRREGYSYREIKEKHRVSRGEIAVIMQAQKIVKRRIEEERRGVGEEKERNRKEIEEEKRAIEEEKERIRKDTGEIKAKRRKVEELKKGEREKLNVRE